MSKFKMSFFDHVMSINQWRAKVVLVDDSAATAATHLGTLLEDLYKYTKYMNKPASKVGHAHGWMKDLFREFAEKHPSVANKIRAALPVNPLYEEFVNDFIFDATSKKVVVDPERLTTHEGVTIEGTGWIPDLSKIVSENSYVPLEKDKPAIIIRKTDPDARIPTGLPPGLFNYKDLPKPPFGPKSDISGHLARNIAALSQGKGGVSFESMVPEDIPFDRKSSAGFLAALYFVRLLDVQIGLIDRVEKLCDGDTNIQKAGFDLLKAVYKSYCEQHKNFEEKLALTMSRADTPERRLLNQVVEALKTEGFDVKAPSPSGWETTMKDLAKKVMGGEDMAGKHLDKVHQDFLNIWAKDYELDPMLLNAPMGKETAARIIAMNEETHKLIHGDPNAKQSPSDREDLDRLMAATRRLSQQKPPVLIVEGKPVKPDSDGYYQVKLREFAGDHGVKPGDFSIREEGATRISGRSLHPDFPAFEPYIALAGVEKPDGKFTVVRDKSRPMSADDSLFRLVPFRVGPEADKLFTKEKEEVYQRFVALGFTRSEATNFTRRDTPHSKAVLDIMEKSPIFSDPAQKAEADRVISTIRSLQDVAPRKTKHRRNHFVSGRLGSVVASYFFHPYLR